jgi:dihydroorotase
MTFGDLEWVLTGERLTAQTFADYRRRGGMVILHNIPEDAVRQAIADPMVMIASDGHLENGKGHPRSAGTYARVLGKYVRDDHALTLTEAIRKMSLAPAQRLENVSAAMGRKGRIRVGADADIAVFDPAAVSDRATYANPALPSVGMRYVLVGGTLVVRDGKLVDGLFPGRGVKSR